MKEHSSQVVCPINYMTRIQNVILLKHKHKKSYRIFLRIHQLCQLKFLVLVLSHSLNTGVFWRKQKKNRKHNTQYVQVMDFKAFLTIVDRFASNTAFMSSTRPPQSHLHLVQ
jgi:hypothetical protein